LIEYCEEHHIKCSTCSIEEIKHQQLETNTGCKDKLVKHVAERYPELLQVYHQELKVKNPYYTKAFEAIGAIELWHTQHD
jgi:hypothetical protein